MKVTFVGGGNMANALIGGMIGRGFIAANIQVIDVLPAARDRLAKQFGVLCSPSVEKLETLGDIIVMAVKPQQMREAAIEIGNRVGKAMVLTIAAGIALTDLSRWLGGATALVRCMPNTPALIGEGITGAYAQPSVNAARRADAEVILAPAGKIVWVDSEALLDPVTAVSGSGPAYVFYFIEAMMQAAAEMGLSEAHGRALALATFAGATALAAQSDDAPAVLRERVTSRGGTTLAALTALEDSGVKAAFVRALHAARRRAEELGR